MLTLGEAPNSEGRVGWLVLALSVAGRGVGAVVVRPALGRGGIDTEGSVREAGRSSIGSLLVGEARERQPLGDRAEGQTPL